MPPPGTRRSWRHPRSGSGSDGSSPRAGEGAEVSLALEPARGRLGERQLSGALMAAVLLPAQPTGPQAEPGEAEGVAQPVPAGAGPLG